MPHARYESGAPDKCFLARPAPRGDAVQLLCCEAYVWDAIQDRYGRWGCAIFPDDALDLCDPRSQI